VATSDTDALGSERAEGYKWHGTNLRLDLRLDKREDVLVERGGDLTVRDQPTKLEDVSDQCILEYVNKGQESRRVQWWSTYTRPSGIMEMSPICGRER
jgi:hypothetical protein